MTTTLLAATTLIIAGCSPHPKGMSSPRWLTDAEKAKATEIALSTPEALELRVKEKRYETRLKWGAISWPENNSTQSYTFDYESIDKGIPENIPKSAELFLVVEVYVAAPTYFPGSLLVAYINPDTGKVAMVQTHGLKKLPTPSDNNTQGY